MNAGARIDHLVVLADSLDAGANWCETTLGVPAGPGGRHPLMGTHNRLLRLDSAAHPRAYLEIIAIDPEASPQRARRWFDMDDAALRTAIRQDGPRLIHFVAEVSDAQAAVAAWRTQGIDIGDALPVSRDTPRGLLQWRITLRDDGRRLFNGCLPTLIQWGDIHPADTMPSSGVALHSVEAAHPLDAAMREAVHTINLALPVHAGPACLRAVLDTPRGRVILDSAGL